tara:strand:- start:3493 stop:3885 length:393 start_codon:yes stop_codon:yes gene_type:complete
MKRVVWTLTFLVVLIFGYLAFFHVHVCVTATSNRSDTLSRLGFCPSFVATRLDVIRAEFEKRVKVGDSAKLLESALKDINVGNSWDPFSRRYQGIIRNSSSNFHAITIHVYVDGQGNYESIEIRDSYTSI